MSYLIDTGVLLRAFDASAPDYRPIRQAVRTIWSQQDRVVTTLQNLAEFWSVSTRPVDRNGYGLSIDRTNRRVLTIERFCEVLTEGDDSYQRLKELLITYSVTGVSVHDARLVSVMLVHGISTILTLNERDFRRYKGIAVLRLEDV